MIQFSQARPSPHLWWGGLGWGVVEIDETMSLGIKEIFFIFIQQDYPCFMPPPP